MLIKISKEDFGTLCICALRYCHGRRTYMPRLVQSIVEHYFGSLSDKDLRVIAEDRRFQDTQRLWGDECDKREWEIFYEKLDEYIKQKGGADGTAD